jgi:hypothetical protein
MKWYNKVTDVVSFITLIFVGCGAAYVGFADMFGWENVIIPTSKDRLFLILVILGFLSLAVGLERFGRFRKVEEQIEKLTRLPDDILLNIQNVYHLVYPNRDMLYAEAAKILSTVSSTGGHKEILLGSLFGFREDRVKTTYTRTGSQAINQFDREIKKCEQSNSCRVREIFNITTEDRLNMIVSRLKDCEHADGYEVRSFSTPHAPAYLSPLIIGEDDAFLSLEDQRYYRVEKAIHLKGKDSIQIVIEYFNSLWNDKEIIVLKSARRIETENIDCFREQLRRSLHS